MTVESTSAAVAARRRPLILQPDMAEIRAGCERWGGGGGKGGVRGVGVTDEV